MEHVVVVDRTGSPMATVPKATAHTSSTPFHLGFSCYVVRDDGAVLLTRRALTKTTWPGVWTNACCGHPQLGESLQDAVRRRLRDELGLEASRMVLALPDFAYRAEMSDGTVEHELCPVVVAEVTGRCRLDPAEVDGVCWVSWPELQQRAASASGSLSPWSVEQIAELSRGGVDPRALLDTADPLGHDPATGADTSARLDTDPRAGVLAPLDDLLGRFLAEKTAALEALDPRLGELCGAIGDLVSGGGKRLRPAFVLWGHRAAGGTRGPVALHAAAAVEVLHTFALLHDDVMDRSTRRRGRPTAHVSLASRHRRERRDGDPDWYGVSAAILAGDLAHVWADELLDRSEVDPSRLADARRVFATLRDEVTAGQFLDLLVATDRGADELDARSVALLKTARYSVTRPLELGAALATGEQLPALRAYGDAVGVAFQLRDDVLGLFGDPDRTGKGIDDDLREGKRTLLVLRALRLAAPRDRDVLAAALGDPDLDHAGASAAREIVAASGALASVEALIAALHGRAQRAAGELPEPARSPLQQLARFAIVRDR